MWIGTHAPECTVVLACFREDGGCYEEAHQKGCGQKPILHVAEVEFTLACTADRTSTAVRVVNHAVQVMCWWHSESRVHSGVE
jgi:hypothetical protein